MNYFPELVSRLKDVPRPYYIITDNFKTYDKLLQFSQNYFSNKSKKRIAVKISTKQILYLLC